MAELPPVLGRAGRTPVFVLVTGRTAVARVGGISAIRRHVATADSLGLEPTVLFPADMRTLGAEIAGELDGRVRCVPANELDLAEYDAETALVIAGDWFISPRAIVAFDAGTSGESVARFEDRGRSVAPLARLSIAAFKKILPKLSGAPVSELINKAVAADAAEFHLEVRDRHRLSDTVAIGRCEAKLFGLKGGPRLPTHVEMFEKLFAIPLARRLAGTSVTPLQVSLGKTAAGFLAAWVFTFPGYVMGIAGTAVYFVSRVLDAVVGDLARAAVRENVQGEKLDVAGELITQMAVVYGLALHLGPTPESLEAGFTALIGMVICGAMAYFKVFRPAWRAGAGKVSEPAVHENFASRFTRSNGALIALALCAIAGRLDVFLVAAAIASHAFYVLWLTTEARS